MAGVNGIEIKVGQVWRCRDGQERRVVNNDGHQNWPWDLENGDSVTDNGAEFEDGESRSDLIELVKDENGFTTWRGGKCPVSGDTLVECRLRYGTVITDQAKALYWSYDEESDEGDIVAYKVVAEITQADSATLAEETLVALGWTFDGQAWVENAVVTMAPNALDVQVGGSHYKDCAIQPIEYIHANKLGFAEGNVVKYITRHRQKHGADDVRKVIHYCQLLLELEYGAGTMEGGV